MFKVNEQSLILHQMLTSQKTQKTQKKKKKKRVKPE